MRFEYNFAIKEYKKIRKYIENNGCRCEVTGSLRRRKKDIGDIDIVVTNEQWIDSKELEKYENTILEVVSKYDEIESRINRYEFMLKSGISIHIIPEIEEHFNYTLWHSTGPKPHVKIIKEKYNKEELIIEMKNNDAIKRYEKKIYTDIGIEYSEPEERYRT